MISEDHVTLKTAVNDAENNSEHKLNCTIYSDRKHVILICNNNSQYVYTTVFSGFFFITNSVLMSIRDF